LFSAAKVPEYAPGTLQKEVFGMADTNDVANCRLSAKRQFTPRPDLGGMTKILIFAVPNNYAK